MRIPSIPTKPMFSNAGAAKSGSPNQGANYTGSKGQVSMVSASFTGLRAKGDSAASLSAIGGPKEATPRIATTNITGMR